MAYTFGWATGDFAIQVRRAITTETPCDHGRRLSGALAALGCALAIAACGSNHSSRNAASNGYTRGLTFSACMRGHGVPNFPDPGPRGYQIGPGSAITGSPADQSAINACIKYLHSSGPSSPVPASMRRQDLAFAKCMRRHGVSNFPDPDANGNIQFPVSSPIPQSPAFQRAQNGPCKKYLSR
jgi:hypothetical protein